MKKENSKPNARAQGVESAKTVISGGGGYTSPGIPQITLPRGGGGIRTIDEKLSVNPVNGTAGCQINFPFSPSRNGFVPAMTLNYNSGGGNGVFGLGWNAEPASIVRRTDKKLPRYRDDIESDVFIFSGAEDLVPVLLKDTSGTWVKDSTTVNGTIIARYRPRIEGGFTRIEKITESNGNVYWKTISSSNVVSIFGKSKSAQLYDPAEPGKIFKWLFEFSYDDKGNCFQYEYTGEDKVNVPYELHEKNRLNDFSVFTNSYLKRIKYCNRVHFHTSDIDFSNWENSLRSIEYLLELVLDYGEHDTDNPQPVTHRGWPCRPDAFSEFRSGFEIRTYRLCRRALMFHKFPELGPAPCLVSSMDMDYETTHSFSYLASVTQKGYIRKADGSYSVKSLPPVEFTYKKPGWNTEIKTLPKESAENLPSGLDNRHYQWVDLYKEGIAGILTEQPGAWYYKTNAGNGKFEGMQLVSGRPSLTGVSSGTLHFADIEGRGQQFLVDGLNGYYELTDDNRWLPFKNFTGVPGISLDDPNLRMLDLDGDGMADILISGEEVFTWYGSAGKEGFDPFQTVRKVLDEEKGPNIIFADKSETLALADMSGDGLLDIVRIRCSEVCYWPNLGYGKFGAKVSMSNAPVFDQKENFNPNYIKLADLDGSGTTDIVYLGKDSFRIYINQSGNSWSEVNAVTGGNSLPSPAMDEYATISLVDLLGNGTACMLWSSSLPQYARQPLLYMDLMGGQKPHLLTSYKNNMGKEVFLEYKPSTYYYLQDKLTGTPWITRLPFPVQCVSQTVIADHIRKSRFTNQYAYHHGYYDHHEREFRGFGRVDQTDTEDFENFKKNSDPLGVIQLVEEEFHQPPVLTKTWFHTGAFPGREKILTQFAHEYYNNRIIPEKTLTDPPLPEELTAGEWREALRAFKGLPLRTELYSLDGSDKQEHPYTTTSHSYLIQQLQPALGNRNAVFLARENESLVYTYERDPADPRIAHGMVIETDEFGHVLKSAGISYGRKAADAALTPAEQEEQNKTHIVFSQYHFTNKVNTATEYRLPLNYETLSYELTGFAPPAGQFFSTGDIDDGFNRATPIAYQAPPTPGAIQKRLTEHVQTRFLKNDLSGALPHGIIESLALPHQSARLSMTPELREFIYGDKVSESLLLLEGKYAHVEDGNYWISSGTQAYDPGNFYQPVEITDPLGAITRIQYDNNYRFFVQTTIDALDNEVTVAGFNYRTLSPYLLKDLNDNFSGVRMDELGMLQGQFTMGKEHEEKGDLMNVSEAEASANERPSVLLEYDLFQYKNTGKPNFIKTTALETHYYGRSSADVPDKTLISYAYADGGGGILMKKVQAEPGLALQENEDGTVTEIDTTPHLRWIGNGRIILNNKGNPVKQYEPYFSVTSGFEDAKQLVERGVTPLITYDAAGRAIRTDMPDGTFARAEFDSWMQRSFDQNDNVLDCQWYKDRVLSPIPSLAIPEETDAAHKAAAHAGTPLVSYLDSLGRNFLTMADNGAAGKFKTRVQMDIEGNTRALTDAGGKVVMQYKYDMLGARLYSLSPEAGERWILNDVMGKPIRSFDSRSQIFRYEYDGLHRPVSVFVQEHNAPEIMTEKIMYGEGVMNDKLLNVRGKPYRHYDTAGVVTHAENDFKGNPLQVTRQLCEEYKNTIDWNKDPELQEEVYGTLSQFDALNRPVQMRSPDNSMTRPVYNEAGTLHEMYVSVKGMPETAFVRNIQYDAKGQRQSITYGNNTKTNYRYHPRTLRLSQCITTGRNGADIFQNLLYTYDPVGNITDIKDGAQQTIFFNNAAVSPSMNYTYDAVYRLISASGREHSGQNQPPAGMNEFRTNLPLPGDGSAMRGYTQQYVYDGAGNILQMIHAAGTGSWTRSYAYEPGSNRLLSNTVNTITESYSYDEHGNILSLSHLSSMRWNFKDQLQRADLGGGGMAYYVYDSGGVRIRKIIERLDGSREERIYLGGFEMYKKTDSGSIVREQTETLHVTDDSRRIAIIETRTIKDSSVIAAGSWQPLTRYQYSNHLDSSSLELDENASIISYEEYHPFGTTSYQAVNAGITAAAKRYRYTGTERDEESGLAYHGARYYLPWLGRWLNADPIGIEGGLNVYQYAQNNPVLATDKNGQEPDFNEFNKKADKNQDGKISSAELDDALTCSTISEQEWASHMMVHAGSYGVDDKVASRIKSHFLPDARQIEQSIKAAENGRKSYGTYMHGGRAYSMSGIEREKLAHDWLHPKEKKLKSLKTTATVAVTLQFPVLTSIVQIGLGIRNDNPEEIALGVLGLVMGGASKIGASTRVAAKAANPAPVKTVLIPTASLGSYETKAQFGLGWLRRRGQAQPWQPGIPGIHLNANGTNPGITTQAGDIYILPGLSQTEHLIVHGHEGMHRLLTPLGTGRITQFRQWLSGYLYEKSTFFKLSEEFLAQSVGTGSYREGLAYINRTVYNPANFNMSRGRVIGEFTLAGTLFGFLFYGGYKLSSSRD